MRVAFGSVVFENAKSYLTDFFDSLVKQTNQEFDILLINDDIPERNLFEEYKEYFEFFKQRVIVIDQTGQSSKPYELRIELIRQAKIKGYDLLILGDCDDIFPENRVENIEKQFDKKYGFFYHELLDFEGSAVMPNLPPVIEGIEPIREANFLGLTNTALNLSLMDADFIDSLAKGTTNVFDWYLFSRLLLSGAAGKKIEQTYTKYRIYDENIAGRSVDTEACLEKERQVKLHHYELLEEYDAGYKLLRKKYEDNLVQKISSEEKSFWWGRLQ